MPKHDKIAVKCDTWEQKEKVIDYVREGKDPYSEFSKQNSDEYINLGNGNNGREETYIKDRFTIITFSEFEKKYLKKEATKFEIGKWYSWYQSNFSTPGQYGKIVAVDTKTDTFNCEPWICNQDTLMGFSGFSLDKAQDIKEISIDVVRKFLPADYKDVRESSEKSTSSNTLSELPEKWCIKVTSPEIASFIDKHNLCNIHVGSSRNVYVDYSSYFNVEAPTSCTKITFEQLKKWVLKEDQKLAEPPSPTSTETWQPKVGEWVMINETQLPITKGWLGEGGRVQHQGPFKVEEIEGTCVTRMSGISVALSCITRFRKTLPHEIPLPQERLQNGTVTPGELYMEMSGLSFKEPKEMTPEQILEECKKRYPVGTKFNSPNPIQGRDYHFGQVVEVANFRWYNGDSITVEQTSKNREAYVYKDKIWAEIIEPAIPGLTPHERLQNGSVTPGELYMEMSGIGFRPTTPPEYVEFIREVSGDSFTTGKVYKVTSYTENNRLSVEKDDQGRGNGWLTKYFKPSTKEAFDKQNGLGGSSDFSPGDWVYVIDAGDGAHGADGRVGQISDKGVIVSGVSGCEAGIKIVIGGDVWGLRKDTFKLRKATQSEIMDEVKGLSGTAIAGGNSLLTGKTGYVTFASSGIDDPMRDIFVSAGQSNEYAGIDPWNSRNYPQQQTILNQLGHLPSFLKSPENNSLKTKPSQTDDVKLPKALILETEQDNLNLITL